MSFIVHHSGTQSLLVDFGRPGWRNLGVPVGGPADRTAMTLGNALVGNDPATTALEMAMVGPTLEATDNHACVVYGASFSVWLNDRRQLPAGKTFNVDAGDVLTIGPAETGMRGYLCARGGFAAKQILGSRSALEPIKEREELNSVASAIRIRYCPLPKNNDDPFLLRILPGGDAGMFPDGDFVNQEYTVARESNRIGIRLHGVPLKREPGERLSAPVCPGTVQITNDGQPVVLGVDAQTIGGYPRIAHVISADLDKLAQLRSDDRVRFKWVSLPEAERVHRDHEKWLREWAVRLANSLL